MEQIKRTEQNPYDSFVELESGERYTLGSQKRGYDPNLESQTMIKGKEKIVTGVFYKECYKVDNNGFPNEMQNGQPRFYRLIEVQQLEEGTDDEYITTDYIVE